MGGDGEAHKNPTYLHHLLLLTPDNDKTHFEKGLVCSAISLFSDIGRTCIRLITILLDLSITWEVVAVVMVVVVGGATLHIMLFSAPPPPPLFQNLSPTERHYPLMAR